MRYSECTICTRTFSVHSALRDDFTLEVRHHIQEVRILHDDWSTRDRRHRMETVIYRINVKSSKTTAFLILGLFRRLVAAFSTDVASVLTLIFFVQLKIPPNNVVTIFLFIMIINKS